MKKLLILPMLAGIALSGCSLFGGVNTDDYDLAPEVKGGTKTQKLAIYEAINNLSPCVGREAQDYFPDRAVTLEEAPDGATGGAVRVTTKQLYENETVELEWAVDESQPAFRAFRDSDGEHKLLEVKYPGFGNPDTQIQWTLKSAKCGKAETTGDKIATYTATIKGRTHKEEPITIAQINKVTEGEQTINGHKYPSTFDEVDYTLDSPYFSVIQDDTTNPEYHYVSVKGKVIYYAPDGNWMLLGDGDQVVEVYAGAGTALIPKNFPSIADGYINVHGNLSQYKGNVQIGFVTSIETVSNQGITDPVLTGKAINEAWYDSVTLDSTVYGGSQKQAIEGFMNCIGKVSGTVVTNSIKNDSGSKIPAKSVNASGRFTFEVKLAEGKNVTVAYDYHTDSDMSAGLFNKIKDKLTAGGSINLKGTMRYSGDNSKPFMIDSSKGVWNIVPFNAADIS